MNCEDLILSNCHKWLWNEHPETRLLAWHVPNERKTHIAEALQLKAKGVVSGVPDYVFNWHGKTYYFEFKTETGRLSKNQSYLLEKLTIHGFLVYVVRNEAQFKNIINEIITKTSTTSIK
jgi:hypothetical protein